MFFPILFIFNVVLDVFSLHFLGKNSKIMFLFVYRG